MTEKKIKKVLPMKYPPITSFPWIADLLSVIINYKKSLPWFYNNYIQLFVERDFEEKNPYLDFYFSGSPWNSCPWICEQRINMELIKKRWPSIINFIIDSIDLGYYVTIIVDVFFIPDYMDYKKKHDLHGIFIFGYNLREKTFDVADFFKNYKYYYTIATFSQIEQGYLNSSKIGGLDIWRKALLISFSKLINKFGGYSFNIDLVKKLLTDYLLSQNNANKLFTFTPNLGNNVVYGLECYKYLQDCLAYCIAGKKDFYFRGAFHVLWDHKKVMLMRINYLKNQGYLTNADLIYSCYEEIEKDTLRYPNKP